MKIVKRNGVTFEMKISQKWGSKSMRKSYKQKPEFLCNEIIHVNDPRFPEYFRLIKERQEADIDRHLRKISVWNYRKQVDKINAEIVRLFQ